MDNGRALRRSAGLAIGLTLLGALAIGPGCRREVPSSGPAAGAAEAAPPAVDPALDERFAFISGRSAGSGPYSAWEGETVWKDFAKAADKAWTDFAAAVLAPMRTWAASELARPRERTRSLFYPFGGPDFTSAATLFPDAPVIVLIGLEPVGNLPEFDRLTPEGRADFFADMGTLALEFLVRGYFVTMDMMDTYSERHVDGALPVIGFFLKREGFSVAGVRRLLPAADGSWAEAPYERLKERPRRPYGVRIDYFKAGDATLRTLFYFSCDIEDRAFREGSPLHRFFNGLERPTTFVKAGSYLLHWDNFSTLRRLILDRSLYVLQDDTAVPYRFFKREGWAITLFGRYATPVKDFTNVEQPDLRAAYEDPESDVRPLPFHFGYRWRTQVDNLMLAGKPLRPYKVPVNK
jgi:hypothetical protein